MDNCVYKLSIKALNDELAILGRVIYKVKNQQRHQKAFKHLQGVRRYGRAIMAYTPKEDELSRERRQQHEEELIAMCNRMRSEA